MNKTGWALPAVAAARPTFAVPEQSFQQKPPADKHLIALNSATACLSIPYARAASAVPSCASRAATKLQIPGWRLRGSPIYGASQRRTRPPSRGRRSFRASSWSVQPMPGTNRTGGGSASALWHCRFRWRDMWAAARSPVTSGYRRIGQIYAVP